ncbi:hypothetical protein [Chitiniphilus shinanonensis]|uniref:hypothetical protein n=1 Tax=Chitiniphilus shinanonensis TaxID=553088 RepID=UPI0030630C9F
MTPIEQFFAHYERGANTFDPELICAEFTEVFLGADPNGVVCLHNDQAFRDAIPLRQAFFSDIGFRSAKVLDIAETPLDARYTLAKVHWRMVFAPQGAPREFEFYISYVLFDPGSGPKVVFYISHEDEQQVMRDGGLIPPLEGKDSA